MIDRLKQVSRWKSSPVKADVQYSVAQFPFLLHLLKKSQLFFCSFNCIYAADLQKNCGINRNLEYVRCDALNNTFME